jgi:hypothetical protein
MNCTIMQRRLLALEDPRRPPPELQAHLVRCPACRAWQRQVIEMEERVPLMPVPPTTAKARLIARVLAGTALPKQEKPVTRPTLPLRHLSRQRDRDYQKVALVAALAFGLIMYAVFVPLSRERPSEPASGTQPAHDPLLAKLLKHDLQLAHWPGDQPPPQRLRTLTDLAGDLEDETKALAEAGTDDDLEALARSYGQVLHDGIEQVARDLDARPAQQDVARRLREASAKMARLADTAPEERARHLHAMADAAGQVGRSLQGEAPQTSAPWQSRRASQGLSTQYSVLSTQYSVLATPYGLGRGPLPACISAAALLAVAQAQVPAAPSAQAEQAQHFRRNRGLIEKLVTGGVRLAREKDPVQRAACCNGLAQSMADEMRQAATEREGARVAELGYHLQELLRGGIADNLHDARQHIPLGSAEERNLEEVKAQTLDFLKSLENDLQRTSEIEGVGKARRDLQPWKERVEKATTPAEK